MKKTNITLCALFVTCMLWAQQDSIFERSVMVERDFQPVVEKAKKVNTTPDILEAVVDATEPDFSNYNEPMEKAHNITPMGHVDMHFPMPEQKHGFLRVGGGYIGSMLDFHYTTVNDNQLLFGVRASHLGNWNRKTLSHTSVGLNLNKAFRKMELFFDADATEIFFVRYGRYFNYTNQNKRTGEFVGIKKFSDYLSEDKGNHWEVNSHIGIRSAGKSPWKYYVQTGYEGFVIGKKQAEHMINSNVGVAWESKNHHVGLDVNLVDHFFTADMDGFEFSDFYISRGDTVAESHHTLKIRPYYELLLKRFTLHLGVNLDMSFNKGKVFQPSPNVSFEWLIAPEWVTLFGHATGDYQVISVRDHFRFNRYLYAQNELASSSSRTYNLIDAMLGLKLHPHTDLLLSVFAGYNYTKDDVFYVPDTKGYTTLVGFNHTHWTVGMNLNYHYQDIVKLSFNAFYNLWNMLKTNGVDAYKDYGLGNWQVLDRPAWGIDLRLDYNINQKWSLYSDNHFAGGRHFLDLNIQAVKARPLIDLNLGAQYAVRKNISLFLQLNNFINWKADIFYAYQTQGINGMIGLNWVF
ncbi:MAG: TonB-dependent receptor [Paludibacteraceae bacterium]|nr:TonB-dependent receptor [Paludibacteraceae bacterium]